MNKFKEALQNLFTDAERNNVSYKEVEKMLLIHFNDWEPPKEKVVIPRFVEDWIEEKRDKYNRPIEYVLFHEYYDREEDFSKDYEIFENEADKWIRNNFREFLYALLEDYDVEQQQYYIKLPQKHSYGESVLLTKDGNIKPFRSYVKIFPDYCELTESEIKSIDERYWAFAVPVEEEK